MKPHDDPQKRLFDLIHRLDKRSKKHWQNQIPKREHSASPSHEESTAAQEYPFKRVRFAEEEKKLVDYSDV